MTVILVFIAIMVLAGLYFLYNFLNEHCAEEFAIVPFNGYSVTLATVSYGLLLLAVFNTPQGHQFQDNGNCIAALVILSIINIVYAIWYFSRMPFLFAIVSMLLINIYGILTLTFFLLILFGMGMQRRNYRNY